MDQRELIEGMSSEVGSLAGSRSFFDSVHHVATPREMIELKSRMIETGAVSEREVAQDLMRIMWRVNRHADGFPGLKRVQTDIQRFTRGEARRHFGAERGRLDRAHAEWLHVFVIGVEREEQKTAASMAVLGVLQLANGCFYSFKKIHLAASSFASVAELAPEKSRTRDREEKIQSEMLAIRDQDGSLARRFK